MFSRENRQKTGRLVLGSRVEFWRRQRNRATRAPVSYDRISAKRGFVRPILLPYLEKLRDELKIPMLYVSHSPTEVAGLADHLMLLDDGRLQASGALNTMLTHPELPLAHMDEASAVLEAIVAEHDERYHLSSVEVPGGHLTVAYNPLLIGSKTRVRILARDVSLQHNALKIRVSATAWWPA